MPSSLLIQTGLWALTLLVLVSAGFVVALRNLFRAALSLGLVLVGVAGLFVLLEAEFLAFVQILIYVGAILTLVVFAIMLTARVSNPRLPPRPPSGSGRQRMAAALVSAALFILLASVTRALAAAGLQPGQAVSLSQVGQELITTLVLPFELISLVFVSAMVGAIAVAASRSPR
ncbi:MAG: NADH-quinone oxidoreductase subunit J [Candidatus Omnitrophica bacterium]|nr:NADH-quinone oxidoreductase subunit J [Candidatus Omnitrophota bacterium]